MIGREGGERKRREGVVKAGKQKVEKHMCSEVGVANQF